MDKLYKETTLILGGIILSKQSEKVIKYRQRIKKALVCAFGGKCCYCGLEDFEEVYDFHHINPEEKEFGIGSARTNHTKTEIANEAKKCCMVCAICHRKLTIGRYKIEDCEIIPFNEKVFFNYLKTPKRRPLPRDKMIEQHNKKIPRETLKEYIRKYSFLECGRKCGVSDNAIRKWCKSYGLPHKKNRY